MKQHVATNRTADHKWMCRVAPSLAIAIGMLGTGWNLNAQPPIRRINMSVDASTPDFHNVPQGIARPCQRATMSAPLPGMLVEMRTRSGDDVTKDQVLATMDNRVARAAMLAARAAAERSAQVDHARHALELARSLYARHLSLQDSQAGAEFELEKARAERDQAEATLASAREAQLQANRNLELELARLEAHTVRAPFDGQVVDVEATVGSTLAVSDTLFTIVCLDALEAELHLPLDYFGKLREGKKYSLWAFAPVDQEISGTLIHASPMIDTASRTFRCLFEIDNRDHRLPAGFGLRFNDVLFEKPSEIPPESAN